MKHKIIKTDNYLLVIGELYKSDNFPYTIAERLTTGEYQLWQVDNPNDWDELNQYKILAHLPLNKATIISDKDLLPPIEIEDDVNELAEFHVSDLDWDTDDYEKNCAKISFIEGYNKARKVFISKIEKEILNNPYYKDSPRLKEGAMMVKVMLDFIYQYPTEFECEVEKDYLYNEDGDKYGLPIHPTNKPKTITTAQGIQWVGKYI